MCTFLYFTECQLQKHILIKQLKEELAKAKKTISEGSKPATAVNGDAASKEHVSKVNAMSMYRRLLVSHRCTLGNHRFRSVPYFHTYNICV